MTKINRSRHIRTPAILIPSLETGSTINSYNPYINIFLSLSLASSTFLSTRIDAYSFVDEYPRSLVAAVSLVILIARYETNIDREKIILEVGK